MSEARKARRGFGEVAKLTNDHFGARYRGPDGADRYQRLLGREILPVFRDAALTTITSDRVAKWFAGMAGTPAQRADAYGLFKSIMHDALQDGFVERNPAQVSGGSRKAPRHEMVVLTVDRLQRYLEAVPVRWRAALVLAGWCGLRSGEVRGLRVRDLAVGAGVVRVRQVVVRLPGRLLVQPPKAAAAMRDVAIPPHLLPALQHWMDDRADRDPAALLRAADGLSPLNDTVLRNAHHRARRAINMPQLTIQDLRHTSATMAAQQGATVAELQARLGHATPRMVQRYEVAAAERNRVPKVRSSAFGTNTPTSIAEQIRRLRIGSARRPLRVQRPKAGPSRRPAARAGLRRAENEQPPCVPEEHSLAGRPGGAQR